MHVSSNYEFCLNGGDLSNIDVPTLVAINPKLIQLKLFRFPPCLEGLPPQLQWLLSVQNMAHHDVNLAGPNASVFCFERGSDGFSDWWLRINAFFQPPKQACIFKLLSEWLQYIAMLSKTTMLFEKPLSSASLFHRTFSTSGWSLRCQ